MLQPNHIYTALQLIDFLCGASIPVHFATLLAQVQPHACHLTISQIESMMGSIT